MPDLRLCAQCRQRPVEPRWRPFCSERCKLIDLGRWLGGDYRIPVEQDRGDALADAEPSADDVDAS